MKRNKGNNRSEIKNNILKFLDGTNDKNGKSREEICKYLGLVSKYKGNLPNIGRHNVMLYKLY